MYYKVKDATLAVSNVDDYSGSSRLLAATTLRNILGTRNLGDILSERESIATEMKQTLDEATDPWGVQVERVEVKDVRVPEQLQRAMAAEAEAAREARAKVIAAEGEHKASRALRQAAEVIVDSPAALQLRYLQTLNSISAENNSTIVFPVPIDIMSSFMATSASDATGSRMHNCGLQSTDLEFDILLYQVTLYAIEKIQCLPVKRYYKLQCSAVHFHYVY